MRVLLLLVLCTFSLQSFSQTVSTTSLRLWIKNCTTNEIDYGKKNDTVYFTNNEDPKFSFKFTPEEYKIGPIRFDSIKIAIYTLKYRNIFDEIVEREVKLINQPISFLTICKDSLNTYTQNTLAKFKNKDSLVIKYNSLGCFHNESIKLTIIKKDSVYVASLYTNRWSEEKIKSSGRTKATKIPVYKSAVLNIEQLNDFIRFENELNFSKKGGCTTTDYYKFECKYLKIEKIDGQCNWDGFFYLRKSFFGSSNYW